MYLGGQYYLPGDPAFKTDVPWTKKQVRQALNMAINRKELLNTVFAGKGTLAYVTGWSDKSEGCNPEWESRFDQMYGYNPAKAKAAAEGGRLRSRASSSSRSWRSPSPASRKARRSPRRSASTTRTSASTTEIEVLDWAKVREMFRKKTIHCCIWPNIICWRPSEEWIRTSYYSKSPTTTTRTSSSTRPTTR